MINLKFLLGFYPSTEKIEAKEAALIKEYNDLEAYKNSEELKTFLELKNEFEKGIFSKKKNELKTLTYSNSDLYKKEKEYKELTKSKRINTYYKTKESALYKNFLHTKDSELIKEFQSQEKIVNSENFKKSQEYLKKLDYKESPEFKRETEYIALSKSKEIKNYYKVLSTEEYKLYSLMHDGADIKHYTQLNELIQKNPDLLKKKFDTNNEAEAKDAELVKEYLTLKKDKRFTDYYKFESSKEFALFNQTINSGIIKKFEELKNYIESPEFKKQKEYLQLPFTKKWEQTEDYQHETAFKSIAAKQEIKDYQKFINSPEFKIYTEVENSGEIKHYEELQEYVKSEEFLKQKQYLSLKFEEKWNKEEESKKEAMYIQILKSDQYKWFTKILNSKKFDELKKWQISFEDDFNNSTLSDKWLTRYFWGDNFLQEGYSMSDDLHFLTDGKNLKIANSILTIETKKEKASGKAWNPMFGFIPKEFEYTSGIINTGKSFRQKYGRFRAKIKANPNEDVYTTFWLSGSQMIPHVDILKYNKNKYFLANFWREGDAMKKLIESMSASKLNSGFFIYEIEWAESKLVWKINNLKIKEINSGIPNEELYMQISAGLQSIKSNLSSSELSIDWVKCYKKVD